MITALFWLIICYVLYKIIFGFVVPLISATWQVRAKMKDMQQEVNGFRKPHGSQTSPDGTHSEASPFKQNASKGDYIDFEEIK
jgi:hypothetical protein